MTESDVVRSSRATVHWLLRGVVVIAATLSLAQACLVGGPAGPFVLPVLLQSVVVLVGIEVSRASRTGLRVDALTLFLGWESLRGCVAPVIIQWFGSGGNFFWRPGTYADATVVLYLGLAFAATVVVTRATAGALAAAAGDRTRRATGAAVRSPLVTVPPLVDGPLTPAVFIALGLVGLVLRFPDVASVTSFLAGDIDGLQRNDVVPKGPITFLSEVARPLLFIGLAMLMRKRHRAGSSTWWLVLPVLGSVVFALGSYGLRRAVMAFAVIALVFVLLDRSSRRIRLVPSVAAVAVLGAFFFGAGTLRSTLWLERTGLEAPEVGIVPALQSVLVYAASPMQLSGAMPWAAETGAFTPWTFVLSLLGPVPGIPDEWRLQSGVALFNHAVYHSFVGRDQLVPTWFEGYLSFGVPGVFGVGLVFGLLMLLSDRMRTRLQSFPAAYAAATVALWVSQPSAVGTYSILQNLLCYALPPLFLVAVGSVLPARALGPRQPFVPTTAVDPAPPRHQTTRSLTGRPTT